MFHTFCVNIVYGKLKESPQQPACSPHTFNVHTGHDTQTAGTGVGSLQYSPTWWLPTSNQTSKNQ